MQSIKNTLHDLFSFIPFLVGEIFWILGEIVRLFERQAVDVISAFVPIIAPIPSAFMVFSALLSIGFDRQVALVAAVAVEALGIAVVNTAFSFWRWDRYKRFTDQHQFLQVAIGVMAFYQALVFVMNVFLIPADVPTRMAKGGLSLLSLMGAVVLALRAQHAQLTQEIEKQAQLAREARMLKRNTAQDSAQLALLRQKAQLHPQLSAQVAGNGRPYRLWDVLPYSEKAGMLNMSTEEIMSKYGVSERTAQLYRRRAMNLNRSYEKE